MDHKVDLTEEELNLISGDTKRVLVRPQSSDFAKVAKGDMLECDGMKLLVLDVRDYPRLEDLFQLEQLEWIVIEKVKDIVEGIKKLKDEYEEAVEENRTFFAIEFAVQK